jgi:hypothetical protein
MNNELSFWGGQVCGKSEFLRVIGPIRSKAFNQRIIRESFKDRGIWPVNGSEIVENLTSQLVIPDLIAPDLRSWGARTPSPNLLTSSSIENTPPKSIEAIKNQSKILKHMGTTTPKLQRDLAKVFTHQQIAAENLLMANDTIARIRAVQEPLRRPITKRQVKPLSQTGVLKLVTRASHADALKRFGFKRLEVRRIVYKIKYTRYVSRETEKIHEYDLCKGKISISLSLSMSVSMSMSI